MHLLTIVASISSIVGAIISIWQAYRSKKFANEAKQIRKGLIDHRKTSELAQIQSSCKKAQKSMEKYGPGSVPSSLKGISSEQDAQNVQEFLLLIRENRTYFVNRNGNEADKLYNIIAPILDKFAQSQDENDLRAHGKEILIHLSSMASIIKNKLDSKRECIH